MKLLIVFEKTAKGYSAFAPDLPGCIATGRTRRGVERAMSEAVEFHVDGMLRNGERLPKALSYATEVDVAS